MAAQAPSILGNRKKNSALIVPMRPFRREQIFSSVRAVYGRQPTSSKRSEPSISAPHSIDFAFLGHEATLVRVPGQPTYRRNIPAGTGGMHGYELLEFVEVEGASEFVELSPALEIRKAAAEYFKAPDAITLDEIQAVDDQVLWAVSSRFRAHAMGGWPLNDLEAESLMRSLIGHLACIYLGGQRPRTNDSRLCAKTLSELRDYIEAFIANPISVKSLAGVVNRSPYHFMRTFALTTGMKPHEFVRAIRMERAKEALLSGARVKEVAIAVGYVPGHRFRNAFHRYFGTHPSTFVDTVR